MFSERESERERERGRKKEKRKEGRKKEEREEENKTNLQFVAFAILWCKCSHHGQLGVENRCTQ